jgi:hypothetical protein
MDMVFGDLHTIETAVPRGAAAEQLIDRSEYR